MGKGFLLATIIAVSASSVGCSSNGEIKKNVNHEKEVSYNQEHLDTLDEYEGNLDSLDGEYIDEVTDNQEYLDALDEYEGNLDSPDGEYIDEVTDNQEYTEELVINNGLKELSREESVNDNQIKIVLDGKIENSENFAPTIIKEAEYFIKNYEKFSAYDAHDIYKSVTIIISAEDMEMYTLFYYGESEQGKLIIFDNQSSGLYIKNKSLDIDYEKKDEEFTSLLSNIEKSLINKHVQK